MGASSRLTLLALILCAGHLAPPPGALPPSVDLGALIRQVHFAWRHEDGGWSARHTTYGARLEDDGAVSFTPFHSAGLRSEVEGQPVRFAAAEVTVGDRPLGATPFRVHHSARGGLRIERDAFVEELDNREEGLEQRWRFPSKPPGTGALLVRIVVRSGQPLGQTAEGLHFEAGALGVRYGHATWVDATGRRSGVTARLEGGAIELRVPRETIESSVFPAVLDPLIGPELGMDQPVSGPSAASQQEPAVACGTTTCLVVWQDERVAASYLDIFGARVSAAGVLLDPAGLAIALGAGDQDRPAVASNGSDFLVSWNDSPSTDLHAARVSGAGVVLDVGGFALSTAPNPQLNPAIAWDGTNYLVAWEDNRSGDSHIHGARVSVGGTILDPASFRFSSAFAFQQHPAVACSGTRCLVTWEDAQTGSAELHGAMVNGAGTVLNGLDLLICTAAGRQQDPSVAWSGRDFVVAWGDTRNGSQDVYGGRVSAAGSPLDGEGVLISTSAVRLDGSTAVACDGTNCLVTWADLRSGYAIYGARVDAAGSVLDGTGLAISSAGTNLVTPSAAWTGANYLVVWSTVANASTTSWDVAGAMVDRGGIALGLPALSISAAANRQRQPAIAWGGTSYLVTWGDARSGTSWDLFGARVDADGNVLDPAGLALSTASGDQQNSAVAWDGMNYLVVWEDSRNGNWDLYAARVSGAGVVLEPAGLPIAQTLDPEYAPALAFDGTNFLVVWDQGGVFAARVSPAAAVLDPRGFSVSPSGGFPSVTWGGPNYLVAWKDGRNGSSTDIYAARVSPAGNVLDPSGLGIGTSPRAKYGAVAAWDGARFFVTWSEVLGGDEALGGALVSPAGTLEDGLKISTGLNARRFQAVAWDGASYLVAWQDRRRGGWDIYRARVSASGRVAGEAPLSAGPFDEQNAVVGCSAPGHCLVAWDGFDSRPGVQSVRVLARVITEPTATPGSATTDEDTPVSVTLWGTDPEGRGLSYALVTGAAIGTLSGTPPNLTYTPAANWVGTDSFTFKVIQGPNESAPASFSVTVRAVNDAPTASAQSVVTPPGIAVSLTLRGADVDGDALTFALRTPPTYGTLAGAPPLVTWTPPADFTGVETFGFVANDGVLDSAEAMVTITVSAGAQGGGGGATDRPRGCGCGTAPVGEWVLLLLIFCCAPKAGGSARRSSQGLLRKQ